jgi:endonuclease YncB( thermonuclease family)
LAEVFVDGHSGNLAMIKSGLDERLVETPRHQDTGPYRKAEEEAKKSGKGMCAQGDKYISPRKWRNVYQN